MVNSHKLHCGIHLHTHHIHAHTNHTQSHVNHVCMDNSQGMLCLEVRGAMLNELHYASVRMCKRGHTVVCCVYVCVCVCLSVCYRYICSAGEIQVLLCACMCTMLYFLGFKFARFWDKAWFRGYSTIWRFLRAMARQLQWQTCSVDHFITWQLDLYYSDSYWW